MAKHYAAAKLLADLIAIAEDANRVTSASPKNERNSLVSRGRRVLAELLGASLGDVRIDPKMVAVARTQDGALVKMALEAIRGFLRDEMVADDETPFVQ